MGIAKAMPYIEVVGTIPAKGATMFVSRLGLFCIAALMSVTIDARLAPVASAEAYDPWPGLVQDIFNNRAMNDGSDVIAIEMPYRAEDAAIVPVTLRTKLSPGDTRRVKTITLVIDQNPAPMAAKFELGADANVSEISTRVRVNNYTDVHAVAELSDGQLYVVKTYVKASGGCSAPAAKNAEEAQGRLGQMRYRQFARPDQGPASSAREAQIMIGHPNNSGLQMDQVTQLYIPAFFVNELHLWQDDSLVLSMEGGISISEDPNIRFTYVSNGAKRFRAEARDTDGHLFQHEWKTDTSGI
jgi:sulfur-oxidizing protein SoxY